MESTKCPKDLHDPEFTTIWSQANDNPPPTTILSRSDRSSSPFETSELLGHNGPSELLGPVRDDQKDRKDQVAGYTRISPTTTEDHPVHRGWRKAVIIAAIVAGSTFTVNVVCAIVAWKKFPVQKAGVAQIYSGDCKVVKTWNTVLHVFINILSTLLLAASNYTMQCLSSPTRSEVDAAHSKNVSLDIGVPGFRNFFYMRRVKGLLWLGLCLSTLPLHLLWNSTVFYFSEEHPFNYMIATEVFLDIPRYTTFEPVNNHTCNADTEPIEMVQFIKAGYVAGNYTNLTIADCYDRYSGKGQIDVRNLILITSNASSTPENYCGYPFPETENPSILAFGYDYTIGPDWFSEATKHVASANPNGFDGVHWHFGPYEIQYCLAERAEPSPCILQLAPLILYVVSACNLVKMICMVATAVYLWNVTEPILATVGDATASFLERRDKTTADRCLINHRRLKRRLLTDKERSVAMRVDSNTPGQLQSITEDLGALEYKRKPRARLSSSIPHTREFWSFYIVIIFWTVGFIAFCATAVVPYGSTSSKIFASKFGAVNKDLVFNLKSKTTTDLFIQVVVANLFQAVFSLVYFSCNSLFTARSAAVEWASYAQGKPKPLRVSWPRGKQRSTYFLHLPYRYGIPLLALQAAMHILISQSIFFAHVAQYDTMTNLMDNLSTVGYSPSAMFTTLCVWTVMIIAMIVHGRTRLDNRMPVHGNKSIVISAMCHADEDEVQLLKEHKAVQEEDDHFRTEEDVPSSISTRPLMWGVTKEPSEADEMWLMRPGEEAPPSIPGHCTFTTREVSLPKQGLYYA